MPKKIVLPSREASFIDTMECLPVPSVPEGPEWTYEIKLDGYRLEAVRTAGDTILYSRRQNVLNKKFSFIAAALGRLPDGTVIDGELVALDTSGRPNFNLLQNFRSDESQITYFAFDILVHKNRDLTRLPRAERRRLLRSVIEVGDHVGISEVSDRTAAEMLTFVREHRLEGLVAKRSDGVYQPGLRSGLWSKHRINLGQEFVIGGYIPSNLGIHSLVVGLLSRDRTHLRIEGSRWLRSGYPTQDLRTDKASRNAHMSLRQPAGTNSRKMGARINRRQDEGVRVA